MNSKLITWPMLQPVTSFFPTELMYKDGRMLIISGLIFEMKREQDR
jgi:hypothetical protein